MTPEELANNRCLHCGKKLLNGCCFDCGLRWIDYDLICLKTGETVSLAQCMVCTENRGQDFIGGQLTIQCACEEDFTDG